MSSEPNARASAVAQSMPSPLSIACALGLELAGDLAVDVEVLRDRRERAADLACSSLAAARRSRRGGRRPRRSRARTRRLPASRPCSACSWLAASNVVFQHASDEVGRPSCSASLGVDHVLARPAARRRAARVVGWLRDLLVHQRLGERRLVALVVAVAAVAEHVDDHVLLELLAEVDRDARRHGRTASGSSPLTWKIGAWIILATSVQYGAERASLGIGGEADLVVDDDVDRAAGAVARELATDQRLGHQALAGEGGVAVDQDRQHLVAARSVAACAACCLARTLPEHDRVDGLQVGRVGGQRQVDGCCRRTRGRTRSPGGT